MNELDRDGVLWLIEKLTARLDVLDRRILRLGDTVRMLSLVMVAMAVALFVSVLVLG